MKKKIWMVWKNKIWMIWKKRFECDEKIRFEWNEKIVFEWYKCLNIKILLQLISISGFDNNNWTISVWP